MCTPPLAQRQLVIGFSPHPHRDKRNVLSPQQLECCWCLLHGGRVKVETAKRTADKSTFYSIYPVPFCRQSIKQKTDNVKCVYPQLHFWVLHCRVRSANPDWNQIISAAPRSKPTHHMEEAQLWTTRPLTTRLETSTAATTNSSNRKWVWWKRKIHWKLPAAKIDLKGEEKQCEVNTDTMSSQQRDGNGDRHRVSISDMTAEKRS